MTVIQSIILAIVEGITEFLPISSTAHLVLTSQLLGVAQTNFVKSFEVIIQLGAILAVIALYFKELSKNAQLWYKTVLAFLPSSVVGFFLYDFIKEQLIGNKLVTALALIIGGLVFTLIDKFVKKGGTGKTRGLIVTLTTTKLLAIGLFQSLAVIPGVSRAAASIFGGLLMGLNKTEATKFSFFLAIPTMLAATSLDLYKSNFSFTQQEIVLLTIGFVGSFITAVLAVKTFIRVVQKHSFLTFGIYRIILGSIWLLLL